MFAFMSGRWPQLVLSLAVGLIVFTVLWAFLAFFLDFWYLGAVLGPVLGIILGGYVAFKIFTKDLVVPSGIKSWVVPTLVIIAIVVGLGRIASIARSPDSPTEQQKQAAIRVAPALVEDCNKSHSCTLLQRPDGSTVSVSIEAGKRVCFDPSFWTNLPRLGFITSFQGGRETRYACTIGQVTAGTCDMTVFDTFRFIPEGNVPLPRYWFTRDSGTVC